MNDHSNTIYNAPTSDFREVRGRTSSIAFFLGMTIIVAPFFLGVRTPSLFLSVLLVSYDSRMEESSRPWIFLVSISAATPIAISRQQIACNLIFAFWFAVFNMKYIFRLPNGFMCRLLWQYLNLDQLDQLDF